MLAGDAAERLASLRSARAPFYRAADVRVETHRSRPRRWPRPSSRRRATRPDARRAGSSTPRSAATIPWARGSARIVLGRDLDAVDPGAAILGPASTGAPVVVADRRAAAPPSRRSWPRSRASAASPSAPASATSGCARSSGCSRPPAPWAPSAAMPGSAWAAARRPTSWVRPPRCTSAACPSWPCPRPGWA